MTRTPAGPYGGAAEPGGLPRPLRVPEGVERDPAAYPKYGEVKAVRAYRRAGRS